MTDPLDLPLRDIHLPDPVPFWPPAPGWWLLAAILVGVIILAWLLYRRHLNLKLSAVRLAREELERIAGEYESREDSLELVRQVSTLLRRVSISIFPRVEVASLTGDRWLAFLDRQVEGEPFSRGEGRILAEAPYQNRLAAAEVALLLQHCRNWIDAVSVSRGVKK